jgi:CBS domain-containing protein
VQIGDICSREVYVVRPDESLAVAVREMNDRHIGSVIVVEPRGELQRPVGIVTDRDVVRGQISRSADLFCLTVGDVMTKNPMMLLETSGVTEAVERLSARGVRRAPVVNASGDLVGIVTVDDLLPVVAEELTSLARLVGAQAVRESRR